MLVGKLKFVGFTLFGVILGLLKPELISKFREAIGPLLFSSIFLLMLQVRKEHCDTLTKNRGMVYLFPILRTTLSLAALGILASAFNFNNSVLIGFLLLCSAPSAISSILVSYTVGGNFVLNILVTVFSTLYSPVIILLVFFFASNQGINLFGFNYFKASFLGLLLPVLLGLIFNKALPVMGREIIARMSNDLPQVTIALIIAIIVSLHNFSANEFVIIAYYFLYEIIVLSLMLLIIYKINLDQEQSLALAAETGLVNLTLCTLISVQFLSNQGLEVMAAAILLQNLMTYFIIALYKKRDIFLVAARYGV